MYQRKKGIFLPVSSGKVRHQKDIREISICVKSKLGRKADTSGVRSSKNLAIFEYDHFYSVIVNQISNFVK